MPYPAPPGPRLAYDVDGTIGLIQREATKEMFDVHPNALRAMNSENGGLTDLGSSSTDRLWSPSEANVNLTLVFPQPIRLYAFLRVAHSRQYTCLPEIQTSPNSTNGIDGDWSTVGTMETSVFYDDGSALSGIGVGATEGVSSRGSSLAVRPFYRLARSASQVLGWETLGGGTTTRNVRALRISRRDVYSLVLGSGNTGVTLHLYGEPDTLASDDRLAFWRPAADLPLAAGALDWGDTPVGSSADKSFRVRNLSTTQTAQDIVLDVLPGSPAGVPPVDGYLLFSLDDGETWEQTVSLTSLSPGATSSLIRVRRVVPSDAALGPYAPRLISQVGAWV